MTERNDEKEPRSSEEELDEVKYESEEELGDVASVTAKLEKTKAELAACKKERQEYLDGWQRCKADAVNARKDMDARAARSAELLREALVHDLIPALDSFDMAAGSEAWSTVSDGWKTGMEQVRDQLISALKRHGVERYGREGDAYDPLLHEVVEERGDLSGKEGTIVRVLRSGYRIVEKVLRPAHIVIKK